MITHSCDVNFSYDVKYNSVYYSMLVISTSKEDCAYRFSCTTLNSFSATDENYLLQLLSLAHCCLDCGVLILIYMDFVFIVRCATFFYCTATILIFDRIGTILIFDRIGTILIFDRIGPIIIFDRIGIHYHFQHSRF